MSFGTNLKDAREKAGLTQRQLATKMNVSPQHISQYENDKRSPKKDTLSQISKALGMGYGYTKEGIPYFYSFVDTVPDPEYAENREFNRQQLENAKKEPELITQEDSLKEDMMNAFDQLNIPGKKKTLEFATDLSGNPKYQKEQQPK